MAVVLSGVLTLAAGSARAASDTWDGSESGAWATAGNWVGNQVPGNTSSGVTASADVATFSNNINTAISIDVGRTVGSLVFANDAGPFTFSGDTLFVSSVTDFSISGTSNVASQTFMVDIAGHTATSGNGIVFSKASGAPLGAMYNIWGDLQAGTNSAGVTNGAVAFIHPIAMLRGVISNPSTATTGVTTLSQDQNAGIVWLRNANTFTGATSMQRGMWIFDSVTDIGGGASALGNPANPTNGTITSGSTVAADEAALYYAGLTPGGHSTNRGYRSTNQTNLVLSAAGTGPLTWTGTVNGVASAGTLAITTNAFILAGPSSGENVFGGVLENTAGDATNPSGLTMSLRKRGEGTWNLTGQNTYTGATQILSGLLRIDFANSGAVNSDIVSASSALQVGGGRLAVRGAAGESNSQTFASTTFREGYMAMSLAPGAGGTALLSLGGLSRAVVGANTNPGGSADFTPNGGTISTTTTTLTNGVLTLGGVAFASVGKTDWATVSGGTIGAVASYQTATNPDDWTSSDNVSLAATPSANVTSRTVNTLRWNGVSALAIDSGNTLSIGAGGILVTGTGSGSISGGTLRGSTSATAAERDLVILQHNTADPFTISSVIANSAGGATALTKGGEGTLELSGANTFSGGITIGGGVLKVSSASAMGASGVKFAGGVLGLAAGDIAATVNATNGVNRFAWQGSGGFAAYGADRTVTFSSNLDLESATTTNSMRSGDLLLGAADSDAKITLATAPGNVINVTNRASTAYMATIRVFNGAAPVDAEISAPITVLANGKGGLQKMGSGVLQLSGQNTFNGPTIIGEGGLLVTGTNFNSMVTEVRSGAWLGGTGTITSLELQPGGRVAPGLLDTIGTLATTASPGNGYFLWNGETTSLPQLDFQLGELDDSSDRLNLGSNAFLRGSGSVFRFDFKGSTAKVGETYTLVTFGSTTFEDATAFSYTNLDPGQTGTFTLTESALTILVVPEPGTIVLAAVAAAAGLGVALRRRAAARG